MKNNKYRKSLKLVNQIQKIRSKNNKNWMNILRLAFKSSPSEASTILSKIYKEDKKIANLAKSLIKKSK